MAPIVVGADRHPDYLTLDEALAERLADYRVLNFDPGDAWVHDGHSGVVRRVRPLAAHVARIRFGAPHTVRRRARRQDASCQRVAGGHRRPRI
jgi:hypothetical protein